MNKQSNFKNLDPTKEKVMKANLTTVKKPINKVPTEPNFIYRGNGHWQTIWIPISPARQAELVAVQAKPTNWKKSYQKK